MGSQTVALAALVSVICLSACSASAPPEVRLGAGTLRGKWTATRSGRPIAAFEGVPYAQPPVGPLRFQPPAAPAPVTGVQLADKPGSHCLQRNIFVGSMVIEGSEDCLYANIYAPETTSRAKPLPVMVYVHGGGFFSGSGWIYGPEYILDNDVVFVNFNYRLGPFGYLSTGDDVIAGNFGMKDQVQALRWVRENIAAFGGDPNSVTIFGESAGGASVHALTISPLAKGLFHRAIAMSGTALSPWAFRSRHQASKAAATLAAAAGCPAQPSQQLLECLMAKPAEAIAATDLPFFEWGVHPMCPFAMTEEAAGPDAFLDKHPLAALAAGPASDVPLVMGIVSHEGCIGAVPILEDDKMQKEMDEIWHDIAPLIFFTKHFDSKTNKAIYEKIRKFYFGDKAIDNSTKSALIDMITDGFFAVSVLEAVKIQKTVAKSPVYLYEIAHPSERSWAIPFGAKEASYGMCHADDLLLMFPLSMVIPGEPSATDKALSKEILNIVTTFAHTGSPTKDGSWPPVRDGAHAEYAYIPEAAQGSVRRDFEPERMSLWRDLPVNVALAASEAPRRDEL